VRRGEPRVLVACFGDRFLGDDRLGNAVVARLEARLDPRRARVVDFGIRGLQLVYALGDGYEAVVFVDGGGLDPLRVFDLAEAMRRAPAQVRVVRCEDGTTRTSAKRIAGLVAAVAEELITGDGRHEGFPAEPAGMTEAWPMRQPAFSSSS
jgi:hydrogenase maturation protease